MLICSCYWYVSSVLCHVCPLGIGSWGHRQRMHWNTPVTHTVGLWKGTEDFDIQYRVRGKWSVETRETSAFKLAVGRPSFISSFVTYLSMCLASLCLHLLATFQEWMLLVTQGEWHFVQVCTSRTTELVLKFRSWDSNETAVCDYSQSTW